MGFFGRLFGSKKQDKSAPARDRRRWSFTRSSSPATHSSKRDAPPLSSVSVNAATDDGLDADKHAIAVAAATAAVAEAALAAAHAAAEVVRLTGGTTAGRSGGGGGSNRRWAQEYLAAVKIQSAFRGYLAKRALRALKALVKLQALVRGHIVRKQTTDMLRRMQTLVRLQARARASRASIVSDSFPSSSSPRSIHTRCVSNAELREIIAMDHRSQVGSNRLEHWSEETLWNSNNSSSIRRDRYVQQYNKEEEEDKILEVDTWKPHLASRTFRSDSNHHNESPRKRQPPVIARSAENSPQVSSRPGSSSGSRRKTVFTPTRSEYSWGCYAGNYYSGYYPNYMANTESYRAKVRSQSAPRQRLEFSDNNGYKSSVQGHYDYFAAAERSFDQRSDVGSSGYRVKLSEGLNRNPSGRSKTTHSSLLI